MPLERGLLHIYTGDGKGKTTAAVGLAVRAKGAGLRVCFVQFIKGGEPSSELAPLNDLGITVMRPAVSPTGLLRAGATEEDRLAVESAWEYARWSLASGEFDVMILDELHIALKHNLLNLDEVLAVLTHRPAHVEVVTTGRAAPPPLRDAADYVTEMTLQKHPFKSGVAARKGIEA